MRIKSILMLLITSMVSFSLYADQPVKLYSFELKNRLSADGSGHYNELIDRLKNEGLNIESEITSLSRMFKFFEEDKNSCIFPSGIRSIVKAIPSLNKEELLEGLYVDRVGIAILTKQDYKGYKGLKSLDGKRLSMWSALKPEQFIPSIKYQSLERSPNDDVQAQLLDRERVDAVVGFVPDMFFAAQKFGLEIPKVQEWIVPRPNEGGASLVCHNTAASKIFIDEYSQIIKKLKDSGELREMLGPMADIGDDFELPYE